MVIPYIIIEEARAGCVVNGLIANIFETLTHVLEQAEEGRANLAKLG